MDSMQHGSASEFFTGRIPLLKKDRPYGFFDNTCFDVALAIATWDFMTGGTVALFCGIKYAIIATLAGNVIGVFIGVISTELASVKYGVDTFTCGKHFFGKNGFKLLYIVIGMTQVGWAVTLTVMCGRAFQNIINTLFGTSLDGGWSLQILAVAAAVASWLIAWRGPIVMRALNKIVAPCMTFVFILMIVLLCKVPGGWAGMMSLDPIAPVDGGEIINFMIAFEINVGAGVSWWNSRGVIGRLCKTSKAAFWPNMFGICLAASVGTVIGVATSLALNSIDPTEWMVPLAGIAMGVLALVFIAVANLSSCPVTVYSACMGLRIYKSFMNMSWGKLTLLFMIPTFIIDAFFPLFIYDHFYIMLGVICVVYVPVVAIQLTDYFFLRQQRLDLVALYDETKESRYNYWGGFNWVAIFVFAVGCVVYLMLFDPIMLVPKPGFTLLSATGATFVVSTILYYVLGKAILVKNKRDVGGYRPISYRGKE